MVAATVREPDLSPKKDALVLAGVVLLLLGMAARLHNAWRAPALSGYDAFAHFTYIWFLADTGQVPLPTHGWSFFHPPLYYALMAGLWKALVSSDPLLRLKVGKVLVAALGCIHAAGAWWVVRRSFPQRPHLGWMAAAFTMLVPVQLYSAGFLGNEALNAVTASVGLLALLWTLEKPSAARAAVLGLALGLAMLAKFTAVVIVAASLTTIAWRGWSRGEVRGAAKTAAIAVGALLLVCGPYYLRSILVYGTPFQLSRDTFMVSYVEDNQPQAARGLLEYLTFDPVVLRRPVWPRGATPLSDPEPHGWSRSVRESVWTGLYANTWFDGFGGWVLPPVVESERSRRSGQALLTLGLLPTGLVVLGLWSAVASLRRRGFDDTTVAFALATAAMLVLFVQGTRAVPIAGAVKATYFTPITLPVAFWFAHGLATLEERCPAWGRAVQSGCALLAVVALAVFWQGFLFDPGSFGQRMPHFAEGAVNQEGIVEYAGGRRMEARRDFEQAAASNYHLALENLAFLAVEDGRAREAMRLLRRAARYQHSQIEGGEIQREKFLRLALAEYDHSMAVVLHGMGNRERALARWHRAIMRDPFHAEALWCLALVKLENGLATARDEPARRNALGDAERALANVRAIDPGLDQGWMLAAAVRAAAGDCEGARGLLREREALPWWTQRRFPAESGTGAAFSASIGRRRLVAPVRPEIDPTRALAACESPPR